MDNESSYWHEYLSICGNEVLQRRKLKLTEEVRQEWIDLLQTVTKLIEVNIEVDFSRDRKDAKFLACAIAANTDFW